MAITRAQQAKQMLQDGGRIGLKGGADAATESFSKSYDRAVGNKPGTTKGRADPKGGFDLGGGQGPTFDGASATTVDSDTVKSEKKKYEKQFFDKGQVPPLGSRPTSFKTKLDQRNKQKKLNYINYLQNQINKKLQKGLMDPSIPGVDVMTEEELLDLAPSVQDLVAKGFYKSDGQFAKGEKIPDFPSTDLPGMLGIAQDIFAGPVTSDKLKELSGQLKTLEGLKTTEGLEGTTFNELMETYEPNRFKLENPPTGGDNASNQDPCKGPNPPAYCNVNQDPTTPDPPSTGVFAGIAPRIAGSIFDFDKLRASAMDGGRMMMDDDPTGGIMDLESGRQMYFLGKLVKKASRAVKKVVKSPFGKAALGAALTFGIPGTSFGGLMGKAGGLSGLKAKLFGEFGGTSRMTKGLLGTLGITGGGGAMKPTLGGGIALGFGVPLALDLLGVGKDDDKMDLDEYYRTQGIDVDAIRNNPYRFLARRFVGMADGGRINYQEGGDAEPVAKKTMPLIDMDGKEKDYRETGGFVDMGRMERADDVPARLSKNEFVFTADAVRNAGDGDIDKGAEVMYNMMKNLESGGDVSEESQGLDGAREMFKTSQRLGEVL